MNKKTVGKAVVVLIIAAIIIFIFTVNFKVPVSISKIKTDTYEDKYKFSGIYIMQEFPAYHGSVNKSDMKAKPGERTSKGSTIMNGVVSPEAGIIVLNFDGWENKYTTANIKSITNKDINSILKNPVKEQGIKIINNSEWFICVPVNDQLADELKKGAAREIMLDDQYYGVTITNNFKNSDGNFIVMKMKNDPDVSNLHRGITGYIIRGRYKGYVVPAKALVNYNGNEGVFIKSNGYAEIRLVKVVFKDEQTAVVEPLQSAMYKLADNDMVIDKPGSIKNGTRVK